MTDRHIRFALPLALAGLIAACGEDPPPPPAPGPAVEAPVVAAPPPPKRNAPPPPEAPRAVENTVSMPAEAIGGAPIVNTVDAYARARSALDKYLADNGIPAQAYYLKGPIEQRPEFYEQMAFGAHQGQAHYLSIKVYNDGSADVTVR